MSTNMKLVFSVELLYCHNCESKSNGCRGTGIMYYSIG